MRVDGEGEGEGRVTCNGLASCSGEDVAVLLVAL